MAASPFGSLHASVVRKGQFVSSTDDASFFEAEGFFLSASFTIRQNLPGFFIADFLLRTFPLLYRKMSSLFSVTGALQP